MQILQKLCLVFTIVGGINWGLVGLFDMNLVESLFSFSVPLIRVIYSLVGICACINLFLLFTHFQENEI